MSTLKPRLNDNLNFTYIYITFIIFIILGWSESRTTVVAVSHYGRSVLEVRFGDSRLRVGTPGSTIQYPFV
jgi:hypothetical protein